MYPIQICLGIKEWKDWRPNCTGFYFGSVNIFGYEIQLTIPTKRKLPRIYDTSSWERNYNLSWLYKKLGYKAK